MLTCDRTQPRHYGDEHGRYWSVSQVCDVVVGAHDYGDPAAMQRGTDLHHIFALAVGHSAGWCSEPDVPQEYAGYYLSILAWIAWANPKPESLEKMWCSTKYRYAGQTDFVGTVGDEYGVLDLKSGLPARRHHLQVCGYGKLLARPAKQWILYIGDDCSFKQVLVKSSARDWAAFQNGLSILQWRESA